MWDVDANPVDPADAIAWFRSKVTMSPEEYRALSDRARRRAFTVAGVTDLDLLNDAYSAVDRAISEGGTLEAFKREVGQRLEKSWGGADATRLQTIFQTNVQSAYSAGRWRQLTDPDVLAERPVWMFDAVMDGRVSPLCKSLDGVTLIAADPFWATHTPPLHFNCRSGILSLTTDQAAERGLTVKRPEVQASSGFGLAPDAGEWEPDFGKYPPQLVEVYESAQEVSFTLADLGEENEFDAFDGSLDTVLTRLYLRDEIQAELKREIYGELFGNDQLHADTLELIYSWTTHYSDDAIQVQMRQVWAELLNDVPPSTDLGQRIKALYETRAARWERLATKLGTARPDAFVAYRAMGGDDFVKDAARAWKAGDKELVMKHHTLASWSLRRSGADIFASSSSSVVYRGEIPFANTLADKLIDDANFVAGYASEVEVIVAMPDPDTFPVAADGLVIRFRQEEYTFERREELIRVVEEEFGEL